MKIKQVQRILMTNFLFVLLVGFLLVLLYETEIRNLLIGQGMSRWSM